MERFADRYTLLRPLGSGGMGTVYLALDRATGQECALKRLVAGTIAVQSEVLQHEFELLSGLRHPLIVRVLDFGRGHDGAPYYTMEYVPGAPVDRVVPAGDWRQLAWVGVQIAFGLEALHAHGIPVTRRPRSCTARPPASPPISSAWGPCSTSSAPVGESPTGRRVSAPPPT